MPTLHFVIHAAEIDKALNHLQSTMTREVQLQQCWLDID